MGKCVSTRRKSKPAAFLHVHRALFFRRGAARGGEKDQPQCYETGRFHVALLLYQRGQLWQVVCEVDVPAIGVPVELLLVVQFIPSVGDGPTPAWRASSFSRSSPRLIRA